MALEEPRRRKRWSSAERPWPQVGPDSGIRAVAGINFEGGQTRRRAADWRRCSQIEERGGREPSRYRAPGVVE